MTRARAVLLVFGLLAGCGPVQSTAYLLDAEVQLEAAQTAGADKYAPYEYTGAKLYITKAREEAGYSQYQVAVDFAKKASELATSAKDKSVAHPKDGPEGSNP
jgi:hypothetical protein